MKTYSLITLKMGDNTYNFTSGIIEIHNEKKEVLEIHVQKNMYNLNSLLETGVDFVVVGNSYRFYVSWEMLFGVE